MMMASIRDFQPEGKDLQGGPLLYLPFTSSVLGKLIWRLGSIFYLDNIPEIYLDKIFEVAYEIEENM